MIRTIKSFEECREFVFGFHGDPSFSDPMLVSGEQLRNNLIKSIEKPEKHCVLGVYRDGQMTGLFAFLVLREERYLEMLVGYLDVTHCFEERKSPLYLINADLPMCKLGVI